MKKDAYVLEVDNISKSFPGVQALKNVSFKVKPGTVHALMGENGAGKSTLMKCIYGIYKYEQGTIKIKGEEVAMSNPHDAINHGVSMIHQELHPVRPQTVSENVFLGRIPYKKYMGVKWVDYKTLNEKTADIFDVLGVDIDPTIKVENLSPAYCQLIEIAKAISVGASIIIMDEPTSSLTETETDILFRIISKLKADNVSIIYISHKIDEILQIADDVTILRDGELVGTWLAEDLDNDKIVSRMVGREMTQRYPTCDHEIGSTYFEVKNYTSTSPYSFKDVSFSVRKGEILGIGGLVGSQRSELVEAIFGLHSISGGELILDGKKICIKKPIDAIKNGFALLTEDRRRTGIMGDLSISDNLLVVDQNLDKYAYTTHGLISYKKRRGVANQYVDMLKVKTPGIDTHIKSLSGGNQQKVLLGRWLLADPDVLILDEPTRGIDVGAKYEIYELMQQLAIEGKCVIMVSSEMPELMGMSDRIIVMHEGRLSGIVHKGEMTEEVIMHLASSYQGKGSIDDDNK